MAYYLKYRGQKFNEIDLKEVRESLLAIVKSKNIPHALLFSGPKGSGKTSAARIFAKTLNCESTSKSLRGPKLEEPCNRCNTCISVTNGSNIDVIEIDAASHRGIDDVRSLREAVRLAPAGSKNKIYIIDESHMLTTEASNALLKTLEEPPDHVYFILATTNPEKLIETIRSRATNIVFKKANSVEIKRSLKRVVKGERLKADDEALSQLAKVADGSFRDAIKTLEHLVSEKVKLTGSKVSERLFRSKVVSAHEFIESLINKDVKKALGLVEKLVNGGVMIETFLSNVVDDLRKMLISKVLEDDEGELSEELSRDQLIDLINTLSDSYNRTGIGPIEQLPLEVAIINWCDTDLSEASLQAFPAQSEPKPKKKAYKVDTNSTSGPKLRPLRIRGNKIPSGVWKKILTAVRPKNASTEALLRAATPLGFDGKSLTLGVFYRFHKERLEEHYHKSLLEEVTEHVLGSKVKVVCTLTEPPGKPEVREVVISDGELAEDKQTEDQVLTDDRDEDIIKAVKEIFGS